jgi:hypothetical protein
MEVPNANVLQRTLWVRCDGKYGSCFTIEVDTRQFIITAAHVAAWIPSRACLMSWVFDGMSVALLNRG